MSDLSPEELLTQKVREVESLWRNRDRRLPPVISVDDSPAFIAIVTLVEGELLVSVSEAMVEAVFGPPPPDPDDRAVHAESFAELYEKIQHGTR